VDHLYVAPEHWRRGYGPLLLNAAKQSADALQLWTFQRNRDARAFYATAGFREVELTAGERNEERTPDVRLVWRSAGTPG
jgi:GNAT superfamily N-acetyltransferase